MLCGCSGGKSPNSNDNPTESSQIFSGKYVNMFSVKENDFNPLRVSSESGRLIISMVFRPLVTVGQNFDYSYCLAENITMSNDCKKVTVTLNKDTKWQDGSQFSSSDIDYTIDKILEYEDSSPYFELFENVSDYYKNGQYGFVFELYNSDSGFPCLLNFPIVKKGALEDGIDLTGTGDFYITDYLEYSSFILNCPSSDGKTIDRIKVSMLPDKQAAYSSFKLGLVDLMKLSGDDASKFSIEDNKNYLVANTNKYTFLAVNHNNPLLSEPTLRRVFAEILSDERIFTDLEPGFLVHTDSFVNPSAYYATVNKNSFDDIKKYLDSIGCLTDDSGIRTKEVDGEEIMLSFDILVNIDNPKRIITAEYIANLLETYGIKITLSKVGYDSYIDALIQGNFDFALCETYISLNNDYSFLIKSDGSANFGGYSSIKADELLDEISTSADKSIKVKLLSQLQAQFYNDMPHIPLWFSTSKIIYNGNLIKEPVIGSVNDEFSNANTWKLK